MTDPGFANSTFEEAFTELWVLLKLGTERERLAAVIAVFDLSGLSPCRLGRIGRAGSPVREAHAVLRAARAIPDTTQAEAMAR